MLTSCLNRFWLTHDFCCCTVRPPASCSENTTTLPQHKHVCNVVCQVLLACVWSQLLTLVLACPGNSPMTKSTSGTLRSSCSPSCCATHPATTIFKSPIRSRLRLACRNGKISGCRSVSRHSSLSTMQRMHDGHSSPHMACPQCCQRLTCNRQALCVPAKCMQQHLPVPH